MLMDWRFGFGRTPNTPGPVEGLEVSEAKERPWKVLALVEPVTGRSLEALAEHVIVAAESDVPELVVDLRALDDPVPTLAAVLRGAADILHWAHGSLILTGPSPQLLRDLQARPDERCLVL